MVPDLARLYAGMARLRRAEVASARLWRDGLISGELHTGIGEEGVAAGVVDHLVDGDGLALDHRATPPMLARGLEPTELFLELLGSPAGALSGGRAGHMHLADRERRMVADGIVGATAPLACGFALEAQLAGAGGVGVAFFGEGATNQGMLLEALNLAVVWRLPVLFVCKESGLAITTRRSEAIGGDLVRRARGFGMPARRVKGWEVERVWRIAGRAIRRARRGRGPSFLVARVFRPDGHFLGDPLLRVFTDPAGQAAELVPPLVQALREPSRAGTGDRVAALARVVRAAGTAGVERVRSYRDPLARVRRKLEPSLVERLDREAEIEIEAALDRALARVEVADG